MIPSWKNSPIKTTPAGLKKVNITSQKPPIHKLTRKVSTVPIGEEDAKKSLKDISSMFEDDGDEPSVVDYEEEYHPETVEDAAMKAMFFSPQQSVQNSFNREESISNPAPEYYWDREIHSEIDEYTYEDEGMPNEKEIHDHGLYPHDRRTVEPSDLSLALKEAFQQQHDQSGDFITVVDSINVIEEMKNNGFLREHVQFLSGFDREFNDRISTASKEDNFRIDFEKETITKLEHFLKLPTDVLHAMAMRQHQELVDQGLFKDT